MKSQKFTSRFAKMCDFAVSLAKTAEADAILVLLDGPTDWVQLAKLTSKQKILVAADVIEQIEGAREAGLDTVLLNMSNHPVYEKLTQALLESVADDILPPGAGVIALYSGFEPRQIDSISFIRLDDHLGRLTVRDLRQLETRVPLDTLKTVVDLAISIGREGREGKPVGTMFVVGDTRNVVKGSHAIGFDPTRGYNKKERNLDEPRVRESIKEVAQLDGAFVVASDGTVVASCQYVDAPAAEITLSKGLGTRHWAAAAITKMTKAVAVVVSESSGTVRIFQNGEIMLRIEPFRRAMKWKDFEYEPPSSGGE